MLSGWQTDGQKVETVSDFIFLGSKVTADGDCSHKIKRDLLLGRKAMTNLDSVLKSRDITADKDLYNQSYMVFPVVVYRCESWTIKKAECQRLDAFELWCWRRLSSLLDSKEIKSAKSLQSCPLSWWCNPTISPSVIPFSSCLQSFPTSGSFPLSQFFASSGQNIVVL